jgi:ankyrin repeat protein
MYRTPLGNALVNKHMDAAKMLIDNGADVNGIDYGEPYLYLFKHDAEIIRMLLDNGADVYIMYRGSSVFILLVGRGDELLDTIKLFISYGIDINMIEWRRTPIYTAIIDKQINTLKLLLSHGADIDVGISIIKETPRSISYESVKCLLDHGLSDDNIDRLLCNAFEYGYNNIIRLIMDKGIDINRITNNDQTLMHLARSIDTIKLLIQEGYDINATDNDGNTILHLAVKNKYHAQLLRFILTNGIDTNITNNDGRTALKVADDIGNKYATVVLLDHEEDQLM